MGSPCGFLARHNGNVRNWKLEKMVKDLNYCEFNGFHLDGPVCEIEINKELHYKRMDSLNKYKVLIIYLTMEKLT